MCFGFLVSVPYSHTPIPSNVVLMRPVRLWLLTTDYYWTLRKRTLAVHLTFLSLSHMATFAQIPSSLSFSTKPLTKSSLFLIPKRSTLLSFHPIKSGINTTTSTSTSTSTVSPSLDEKLEVNAHAAEKKAEEKAPQDLVSPGTFTTHEAKLEVPKKFNDPRWVKGTWDLDQFVKNGRTDWDAVIDAGKFATSFSRNYITRFCSFKFPFFCNLRLFWVLLKYPFNFICWLMVIAIGSIWNLNNALSLVNLDWVNRFLSIGEGAAKKYPWLHKVLPP